MTVGETMGLVVSTEIGPLASSRSVALMVGGAESNVAIAFTRLGGSATWVSRLGSDPIGDLVESQLRSAGVEVIAPRLLGSTTGVMVKERRTVQHRRVTYYRSASAARALNPDDVETELIESSRIVHLTGITPALSASAQQMVLDVARRARRAGVTVSFDVNYRSQLWTASEASAFLADLRPSIDVLFGDPGELDLVASGLGAIDAAHEAVRGEGGGGPREIVIKLGDRGAVAVTPDAVEQIDAYPVEVVDTVGAGDAFVGGYLSALAEGASVAERLDRAARCGALQCTVLGDWEGTPRRAELALLDPGGEVAR